MAKQVMIVEDDNDMNIILSDIIREKGFDVSNYYDGNTALKDFEKNKFVLAILDYKLPKMSGIEVLQCIRSLDPDIKVFMISAHGDTKIKDKAIESGAVDFLDKPFDLNVFNSIFNECLDECPG